MKKVRILLVDDHKLVTVGFKMLLSENIAFEVVAETGNGKSVVNLCEELNVDLVLMDINLPDINGIDSTKILKNKLPDVKVIMLSMNEDEDSIFKADQAGAEGYLLKTIEKEELEYAINLVITGSKYYSKTISEEVIYKIKNKLYETQKGILTSRELEILKEISIGSSIKQIAEKLFISDRTVNTHKTNIYKKMEVKNSVELLVRAREKKMI